MNDQARLPDWAQGNIAVFDLETTGLDLGTARIVTACAVELNPAGEVVGRNQEWLANPGVPIPPAASAVHGITDEIAAERGSNLALVVTEIIDTLRGYFDRGLPVIAYNAPYDFTILRQHAEDFGVDWIDAAKPVIDPLVLDRRLVKFRSGKRNLERIVGEYGVALNDAHNATADAVAAGRLAQAMAKAFPMELGLPLDQLHDLQVQWSKEQDTDFANWMQKQGRTDFKPILGWPEKPR